MSTRRESTQARRPWSGISAALLGAVGLLGFGWLWLITATPVDPPEWARIAGVWLMPLGAVGAAIIGGTSLRGPGRPWSIAGLVLAAVTLVAAVLLFLLWPM